METYNHKDVEEKWQKQWEKDQLYKAPEHAKKKQYILDMFPYPSGAGLHVGHPEGYTATDILSRFLRMQGFDVLHPMGWDAFGLPAENYAIKEGVAPAISTAKNINRFREQIKSIGLSYDWSREVNTSEPEYYRWTQWLFIQLYKKGLAYKKEAYVNWCPKDQTVLANEQVVDGCCERCGTKVIQKLLSQWFFKITDYADRLLDDLNKLDWPEPIKLMQKNWIGRSEGAEIEFESGDKNNFIVLHGWEGDSKDSNYVSIKNAIEKTGAKCFLPDLPNTKTPTEREQVNYILLHAKFDQNTILFGKSLGAVVAMKVIEKLEKPIAGLILAGGFLGPEGLYKKDYPYEKTFDWHFDFEKIKKNAGFIKILSDLEDRAVMPEQGRILQKKLGAELTEEVAVKPHFGADYEPMIMDALLPPKIKVFTTRPDTLFGATYLVLAPEHPLVGRIASVIPEIRHKVFEYQVQTQTKSELERTSLEKEKTGVFTGAYAINPATKEKIPIWVADYVLATYGTGAIMAVPAHDERDFAFAQKYSLPIIEVVKNTALQPSDNLRGGKKALDKAGELYIGDGILINSDKFDGLESEKAKKEIIKAFGTAKVQYKLRDWLISRQRYWGAPIPIIYCEKCGMQAVPEEDLPVKLPTDVDFQPKGQSPLASSKSFHQVKCPNCEGSAQRDSDTMDTFVDSSWYFFRFADPHNDKVFADKKKIKNWLPVDTYVGGAEHAVLHLLYARFFTKALADLGYVNFEEPFIKLRNQGLILGPDGEKMSKSRGNVINPDEVIGQYGADAFRMYEMFMGPLEDTKPWQITGIVGVKRFLDKVWRYSQVFEAARDNRQIHKLTRKITSDIQNFKFNTAVAAFMEFLNENKQLSKENWETFLILLAPFAPHMTEDLWHQLGHRESIHKQSWPEYDEDLVKEDSVTVVVQVLGRLRASLELPSGTGLAEVKKKALADPNVKRYLNGKKILKEVFVQDRLINFVVK